MDSKTEIKQIEDRLREISKRYHEWINGDTPSDYGEFCRQSEEIQKDVQPLERRLQEITEVVWRDIPDYGHLMTFSKFKKYCESGLFIDYDGVGNYASKNKMSNKIISPSDFEDGWVLKNPEFTHVVWFNR
jgi:hypothetical protein